MKNTFRLLLLIKNSTVSISLYSQIILLFQIMKINSQLLQLIHSLSHSLVHILCVIGCFEGWILEWSCCIHSFCHPSYPLHDFVWHMLSKLQKIWMTPPFSWIWYRLFCFEVQVSRSFNLIWIWSHEVQVWWEPTFALL